MTKIYLAARYSRHPEMQSYAAQLGELGHTIVSRWILGDHDLRAKGESDSFQWMQVWANEDLDDLSRSQLAIFFTEGENPPGRARGGRHVEYGYAMAHAKRILVVGPRENVFHYLLPENRVFATFDDCLKYLKGGVQ